jgi:hypothetical protein
VEHPREMLDATVGDLSPGVQRLYARGEDELAQRVWVMVMPVRCTVLYARGKDVYRLSTHALQGRAHEPLKCVHSPPVWFPCMLMTKHASCMHLA